MDNMIIAVMLIVITAAMLFVFSLPAFFTATHKMIFALILLAVAAVVIVREFD